MSHQSMHTVMKEYFQYKELLLNKNKSKANEYIYQANFVIGIEDKLTALLTEIKSIPLLWVGDKQFLLDTKQDILWDTCGESGEYRTDEEIDIREEVHKSHINLDANGWSLPSVKQLFSFFKT